MSRATQVFDELQRLIAEGDSDLLSAPLPEMWGVLYTEPAPGGEKRNCRNCSFWVSKELKCILHGSVVEVTADHICGMHIFGQPMKVWLDLPGIQSLNPKFSALNRVPGGTACERCKFFMKTGDEEGNCIAVRKKKKPAPVHPLGCCTRFELREPSETKPPGLAT